jgi:hypothetical protein
MSRAIDIASPITVDVITATSSENFAVLGCFAPNSLDTLTLTAAFIPIAIIAVHPKMFMQMERAATEISAFFKYPANNMTAIRYHTSKLPK